MMVVYSLKDFLNLGVNLTKKVLKLNFSRRNCKNRNLYLINGFKTNSNLPETDNDINMLSFKSSLPKLNKICFRLISSSILAGIGLISGSIPQISLSSLPSISFSINAEAQEFTAEETTNYAKAGYEVELLRREVYQEIKTLINEPLPNIACDRQETFKNLNPNIRDIATRYCNQSQQIVQQNNLSINRFNELKSYYDRRDDFYQQVQHTLLKLRN